MIGTKGGAKPDRRRVDFEKVLSFFFFFFIILHASSGSEIAQSSSIHVHKSLLKGSNLQYFKMAVKKRTTLRTKLSKRAVNGSNAVSGTTSESQRKDKIIDKLAEKSVKTKSDVVSHSMKSNSVMPNLSDPKQVGISKSAIRRRKRKLRDQLTPKLTEDLLDALTESTNATINKKKDGTEEITIEEKAKLDHTPNPLNKRGQMALFKIENENFKQMLKSKELRTGGLAALRNSLLSNIANQS